MNIKKKLIAISLVAAMGISFGACSDKGSGSTASNGGEVAAPSETLSSQEIEQIAKHDLTFQLYDPSTQGGVEQDPVESSANGQDTQSGNNNAQSGDDNNAQGGGNDNNAQGGNNNNAQSGGSNNNAQSGNSSSGGVQTPADIGNNRVDLPQETGLQVIQGKKMVVQSYWMDLSEQADKVFNGEYLKAQFKIKEGVQDGIYPITIEKADFSNWGDPDPQTVKFKCIDGAVVVGGEAKENTFDDSSSEPQLLTSNVAGKAGDTVTVIFSVKNNPGVVGNIFAFGFNSDALEYIGGENGADFDGRFTS